ncbi:unnamed protein product, partial [marine sediment metagenome]
LEDLESKTPKNKLRGVGKMPTDKDRTGGDIVNDPVKLKEYQRKYAIYAYMRLVEMTNNTHFQKTHMREYMELNKYLYEVSFGKPSYTVTADLGEMPMNINFLVAPKPKELTDGKTTNGTEITTGNTGTEEATS